MKGWYFMRQYSYALHNAGDIPKAIAYFKQCYTPETAEGFFSVTTPLNTPAWIASIQQAICDAFPNTPLSGMTTASSIQGGRMHHTGTGITLQVFEKSKVRQFCYNLTKQSLEDVAVQCLKDIQSLPHVAGVQIRYAQKKVLGHPEDLQIFLDQLSSLDESIPVWGGYADMPTFGNQSFIFCNSEIHAAGLIITIYLGDIHIEAQSVLGFQPLGRLMTVTAMDGPMVIKEMDHKPATFFYEKYLHYTNFKNKTLPFPLLHQKYGSVHAHMPLEAREDGALCFNTVSYVGDQLHLSYGDPNAILQASQKVFCKIRHFSPEGIHLTSCNTRRLFLKENGNAIIEGYEKLAPSSGCYVDGEIFRHGKKIIGTNMMLVATSFREGEPKPISKKCKQHKQVDLDDSLSTIQYLATFIQVAMNELEETMNQLTFAASHDNFTGLLNRSSIENLLQKNMAECNKNNQPFSAIMVDVDFFKQVNDYCGHDVGDQVLLKVAHTIQANIRPTDFAGRWGGDEFVILLPGQPLEHAQTIAERLREHIYITGLMPNDTPITASFGVTISVPGESEIDFYKRMDNALYKAKDAGKNQVILLQPKKDIATLIGHHK